MTAEIHKPPPVLGGARVLEYAVLDKSVKYSGHSSLFVDGTELGEVPCLAICQPFDEGAHAMLFHCSGEWTILGAAEYLSVAQAKDRAERIYSGVSTHWIKAHVTEQEVERYLAELCSEQQCGFCGRRPDQVEQLIGKNGLHICDSCIKEFHKMLQEEP